jgi:hypothetical protein
MSNISTESIGKVILQDVSYRSVSRCESKAGAALMATSKAHFEQVQHEISTIEAGSWMLCFNSYRQDATNERRKRSTLELHSGFITPSDRRASTRKDTTTWDQDGFSLTRLSDVLPISDETAAGTVGFTAKALKSLGCPTWDVIQKWNETLR